MNQNQKSLSYVAPVNHGSTQEMLAYDMLPKTLRRMLRDCPFDITAVDILEVWQRDGYHATRWALIDLIRKYRHMAEEERRREQT